MEIHIKCVTPVHERVQNFLGQFQAKVKNMKISWRLDTFTVKGATKKVQNELVKFKKELECEGQTILVKKNGL